MTTEEVQNPIEETKQQNNQTFPREYSEAEDMSSTSRTPTKQSSPRNSRKFFDRSLLNRTKRKPKPLVFHIYLYCKCEQITTNNIPEQKGVWSALLIQQPQDMTERRSKGDTINPNTNIAATFMLTGIETNQSYVRMRLQAAQQCLEWISSNLIEAQYPHLEISLLCNDIFIVNNLRDWIPRWYKKGKNNMSTTRPNVDILDKIAMISTKAKLSVKWVHDNDYELSCVKMKAEEQLRSITNVSK